MINVVIPVVALSTAPLSHHSRENASEVAHKYVESLGMSLKCRTFAALYNPGVSCVTNTVLKIHYIRSTFV